MAYKEKDTKKWTAQWFETNVRGSSYVAGELYMDKNAEKRSISRI